MAASGALNLRLTMFKKIGSLPFHFLLERHVLYRHDKRCHALIIRRDGAEVEQGCDPLTVGTLDDDSSARTDSRLNEIKSQVLALKTVTLTGEVLISASRSTLARCSSRYRRTLVMASAEKDANITSVFSSSGVNALPPSFSVRKKVPTRSPLWRIPRSETSVKNSGALAVGTRADSNTEYGCSDPLTAAVPRSNRGV